MSISLDARTKEYVRIFWEKTQNEEIQGPRIAATVIPRFLDDIFHRYQINSIGAFTYASNQRSLRALQKSGFLLVETFEEDGVASNYLETKKG